MHHGAMRHRLPAGGAASGRVTAPAPGAARPARRRSAPTAPPPCGALDLLAEARAAALLLGSLPARRRCAWRPSAAPRALGLAAEIGSIEPGKAADLTCIDLGALADTPAPTGRGGDRVRCHPRAGERCVGPGRVAVSWRTAARVRSSRARSAAEGVGAAPRARSGCMSAPAGSAGSGGARQRRPRGAGEVRCHRRSASGIRAGSSVRCTCSIPCARSSSPQRVGLAGSRVLDVGCGGGPAGGGAGARRRHRDRHRSGAGHDRGGAAARAPRAASASTIAIAAAEEWHAPRQKRSTSSPAWRCSSTCPSPPP